MIELRIVSQYGGRTVFETKFELRPVSVRLERDAAPQNAVALEIADDVFRIGPIVLVIPVINIDLGWIARLDKVHHTSSTAARIERRSCSFVYGALRVAPR